MSLLGLSPTLTATRTLPAALEVAFQTNITLPSTLTVKNATTTTPTPLADVVGNSYAGSRIVVGTSMNYAKIQPFTSASGGSLTMHVIGWNRGQDGYWRPQLFNTCTVVAGTATTAINGSNLYAGLTYTKTHGDCKIYSGNTAAAHGGFILVDLCGAELLEIAMSAASTPTANVLIGFI